MSRFLPSDPAGPESGGGQCLVLSNGPKSWGGQCLVLSHGHSQIPNSHPSNVSFFFSGLRFVHGFEQSVSCPCLQSPVNVSVFEKGCIHISFTQFQWMIIKQCISTIPIKSPDHVSIFKNQCTKPILFRGGKIYSHILKHWKNHPPPQRDHFVHWFLKISVQNYVVSIHKNIHYFNRFSLFCKHLQTKWPLVPHCFDLCPGLTCSQVSVEVRCDLGPQVAHFKHLTHLCRWKLCHFLAGKGSVQC